LPYVAEFTTLAVNLSSPSAGDSTGRFKSTGRVALQIEDDPQSVDVRICEFAITRRGPDRGDKTLLLKKAKL
jgi:hypothetical protein